ncbi:MAG: dihydroorotase [candidate division WOR-3 bacterium]|nr:dihydroorotase [candidate division WOR-3 bacterium]MCX7836780.1 dihydroorotase [candidate division WOR-3 bacterium]MDW8113582.1 dihydroorotase [candidate division WOR-3 bacterium]
MKIENLPEYFLLKNGILIDLDKKEKREVDILIKEGKIEKIAKEIEKKEKFKILDVKDCYIFPGLIDLHTHLRIPGREDEETIETGTKAAIAGGFTKICCMPNTEPPLDNESLITYLIEENKKYNYCDIYPIACATKKREGKELCDYYFLKKAGAIAISDDGSPISSSQILRLVLEYSKTFDLPYFSHCEDKELARGVINEGFISYKLGLRGIPDISETIFAFRDVLIANYVKSKIHLCHISSKKTVEVLRFLKENNYRFTCETAPHYFTLTENDIKNYDTNYKVNPPLKREEDKEEIKKALKEGLIDVIASDHAPHLLSEKEEDFEKAPFGIIGLETCFLLSYEELVLKGNLTIFELLEKFITNPTKILGIEINRIKEGNWAELVIFSPKEKFIYSEDKIHSKSKNTPFLNKEFKSKIKAVINNNKIFYI